MQCQFKIGDLVILAESPATRVWGVVSAKFAHDLPGMLVRIQPIKYHLAASEMTIIWHMVYWADLTCTRHAGWQLRKL